MKKTAAVKKTGRTKKAAREVRAGFRDPDEWFFDALTGGKLRSGQTVTSSTALAVSAYFACIRNISEDIAKLPRSVMKRLPRGREAQPGHPVQRLMKTPNDEMGAMDFFTAWIAGALGYHGGFAEIVRDGQYRPVELHPLVPNDVSLVRDRATRKLFFKVTNTEGRPDTNLPYEDVLYLHGLGLDGITQFCIYKIAKESLGTAIAARDFAAEFFGNGATTTGMLKIPQVLKPEVYDRLRKSFTERHIGDRNRHKPMILEQGLDWISTSIDPEKSQMILTQRFTVEDVCRWYRVPKRKVQEDSSAVRANIEQDAIEYVTDCISAWLRRVEEELDAKLFTSEELADGFYIRHNERALMRGDMAAEATYFREMFNIGRYSINDMAEICDENPIPAEQGGDIRWVQANIMPASRGVAIADEPLTPPLLESKPKPMPDEMPGGDMNAGRAATAILIHRRVMADAFGRRVNMDRDRILRAQKHPEGFDEWLRAWLEQSRSQLANSLNVAFNSFALASARTLPGPDLDELVDDAVARYQAQLCATVQSGGMELWNREMAERIAETEISMAATRLRM